MFEDEIREHLKFTNRGIVAMANAGKDMNGSRFSSRSRKRRTSTGRIPSSGKSSMDFRFGYDGESEGGRIHETVDGREDRKGDIRESNGISMMEK